MIGCMVTDEGVKNLQEALLNCKIQHCPLPLTGQVVAWIPINSTLFSDASTNDPA